MDGNCSYIIAHTDYCKGIFNQDRNVSLQLKKLRSLLIAGANGYEEFYPHLRLLEPAMQLSIKDLR